MAKKQTSLTLTKLLRMALSATESLSEVQRKTGILRQSMMKLLRGKTIRLDSADTLARYFGITVNAPKAKARKGTTRKGK